MRHVTYINKYVGRSAATHHGAVSGPQDAGCLSHRSEKRWSMGYVERHTVRSCDGARFAQASGVDAALITQLRKLEYSDSFELDLSFIREVKSRHILKC